MTACACCGKILTPDEIAVTKKLISRGAAEFYCVACLAEWFEVTPEEIRRRIETFRRMGCTLFVQRE